MWSGILNIIIGLIFIGCGLSGVVVLRGTQSSGALVIIGLVLIGVGLFQMIRNKRE